MTTAAKAISEAVKQAKLAYEFSAGSYTYAAMSACLAADEALHNDPPDWIGEFLAHQEAAQ